MSSAFPERVAASPVWSSVAALERWVLWTAALREKPGRPPRLTKEPVCALTGRKASTTNPATWTTLAIAISRRRALPSFSSLGLGFVFAAEDALIGVDLDDCCDRQARTIKTWALDVVRRLNTYTEFSPSGRGLHLILHGRLPGNRGREVGGIAAYSCGRYFTVTAEPFPGLPLRIEDRQDALTTLLDELGAEIITTTPDPESLPSSDEQPIPPAADDQRLLARAVRGRDGPRFAALFDGNMAVVRALYGDHRDHAMLALCVMLARLTRGNVRWIDRLFRQSRLYRPEKWDAPRTTWGTWGRRTIARALACLRDADA
jgi:primase-polymerase (primpol)-like protein